MSSTREMHAEVMRVLECMNTKIDGVASLSEQTRSELQRLSPQNRVHPIPRPKQGSKMTRGASVTKYIRQYTTEKNQAASEGEALYELFKEDIEDKQYNTDALNCLEWILGLHLGSELGELTWEQVCKQSPGKMGLIIRDAVKAPELRIFAQAAGQWAIQMLISNKMNSRIRYTKDHRAEDVHIQEAIGLAPVTVPDLEQDPTLVQDVLDQNQEWIPDYEVEARPLIERNVTNPSRSTQIQPQVLRPTRGRGRRTITQAQQTPNDGILGATGVGLLPTTDDGSIGVVGTNQVIRIARSDQNLRSVASRGRGISRISRGRTRGRGRGVATGVRTRVTRRRAVRQ